MFRKFCLTSFRELEILANFAKFASFANFANGWFWETSWFEYFRDFHVWAISPKFRELLQILDFASFIIYVWWNLSDKSFFLIICRLSNMKLLTQLITVHELMLCEFRECFSCVEIFADFSLISWVINFRGWKCSRIFANLRGIRVYISTRVYPRENFCL